MLPTIRITSNPIRSKPNQTKPAPTTDDRTRTLSFSPNTCIYIIYIQGYRSTDHVPLHFTTPTARDTGPRKKGALVVGEVVGVTAAGVAMATAAVMAARDQIGASPWRAWRGGILFYHASFFFFFLKFFCFFSEKSGRPRAERDEARSEARAKRLGKARRKEGQKMELFLYTYTELSKLLRITAVIHISHITHTIPTGIIFVVRQAGRQADRRRSMISYHHIQSYHDAIPTPFSPITDGSMSSAQPNAADQNDMYVWYVWMIRFWLILYQVVRCKRPAINSKSFLQISVLVVCMYICECVISAAHVTVGLDRPYDQ